MLDPRSAWHVRAWDDGAVAWNSVSGDTHAVDPLTAEVLSASRLQGVSDEQLPQYLAQRLALPLDETLQHAILGALDRIRQLEAP